MKQDKNAQGKRRSLQNMTPNELVNVHSRNFTIQYREVALAEVKRWLFQSQLRFHIASTGQTIRFNLSKKQAQEAQRLLKLVSL